MRDGRLVVWLPAILAVVLLAGCARVQTRTRRDIFGRPVTTTTTRGPGGREVSTVTRGDKALPVEGYMFNGTASGAIRTSSTGEAPPSRQPSRSSYGSIFSGGGTWYVNGKRVDAPAGNPGYVPPPPPDQPEYGPQPEPESSEPSEE